MPPPLAFLVLFHSVPTEGRRCCFLYWSLPHPPHTLPEGAPLPPASALSILKLYLSFPWAHRPCPSLLNVPSPLFFSQVLILSYVHASVLLLPYPKFSLPSTFPHASSLSVASIRGQEESWGRHLGSLPLFYPSSHPGLCVLGFCQKLGPPGASQGRLVPVAPALLQPPPVPVGLSTPRLRLFHLCNPPPQGQRTGA